MIVNNKKLNPYLEVVNFSSRNVDQKKLGTVLGIFEIKDLSDDSAYIVNFLSSVAKKTYFAGHQKNPEESFESTLAKVNLSLAEIANHGNVNWIGKIDAVLCSIFEDQINFSVSGDAKVLLLRNQKLMEISESLSPKDEAVNPLKTFTDIASGKLEKGDKLILTTDDISHVFTLEEIERNALEFENEKFIRFLKTALVNELEIAGTIVLDIKEKTEISEQKVVSEGELDPIPAVTEKNLFGSAAFEKRPEDSVKAEMEKKLSEKNQEKTYTNQKTGHIYITDSGDDFSSPEENKFEAWLVIAKEKMSDFGFWLQENYLRKLKYKTKKFIENIFKKTTEPDDHAWSEKAPAPKESASKTSLSQDTKEFSRKIFSRLSDLKTERKTVSPSLSPQTPPMREIPAKTSKTKLLINCSRSVKNKFDFKKITDLFGLLIPRFSKIKQNFLEMSLKKKIITLILISLIIFVPFWFFKKKEESPSVVNEVANSNEDLKINPSSEFYKESEKIYSDSELIGAFIFNNSVFAVNRNKIVSVTDNKEYLFPENFQNARKYSFMNDLNLLFLIDEKNRLMSFSPISLKFNNDTINISDNAEIKAIGSYLTYLYIIDSANRQIYRYPRAENGFGEKINWLQDDIDLENINGMAIDGNLYLSKKDSIIKLFNRKIQNFELKKDADSSIDKIFTDEDTVSLYVLDKTNGELDKYGKEGDKQAFVSNQALTEAVDIRIDEKNSLAYFITSEGMFKINLPQ